ncbi:PUF domain-containing protein [Cephalotus follicularis]|uniref:PUF domain-containing protein n=1 Tax=Cephalotus follicularis TaxID=3775 RepID=A0A1Q3C724_CEPFO|nr:PUF domain-containing protein [Cephalotus follicularis]
MATESPIRMPETSGKWPTHKDGASFSPLSTNVAGEELGLHRKGPRVAPNRSGSAPPSVEGSLFAIGNLISQRMSEEQLCADPAYLAYYRSNVNLNPRLPPPRNSLENQHLLRRMGGNGSNWGLTSIDDSGNGSLHLRQDSLSTHNEEPENDQSLQQPSDDLVHTTNGFWTGQDAASLAGQNKILVDLIQEDFPRTPSPIYNQPYSSSCQEAVDHDPPVSSPNTDPLATPRSSPAFPGCTGITSTTLPLHKGVMKDETLIGGVNNSDATLLESKLKGLNISGLSISQVQRNGEQLQNNLLQHHVHQQQSNSFQVQNAKSQMSSQGINTAYTGKDQFFHGTSKFSAELQPVLQSSGFTPPPYAAAAGYMTSANPYYSNPQAPGFYSPQYGVGGYSLNSAVVPSFMSGYPPHNAIPLVFDGTAGPNINMRMPGVPAGGSVGLAADVQHLNKFYGQFGYALQPSFADPVYMQYYQQPFGEAYSISGQFDPLASRVAVMGSQNLAIDSQKGSESAASLDDQKSQQQRSGGLSGLNPGRGGIMSNYFGSPPNMDIFMQYPSPLSSPVLTGSPAGGAGLPGGRNEMRFASGSGRYAGVYSGWQGQRGPEIANDSKVYNFLEELKSGKGRRFELSDIAGHIVEFSSDQHGSRFIQQKLENCSFEEKACVFREVLPCASKLMTDVFGNYVIQKFFEYGSPEQRKELANQLLGQILPLSLQMYGCRVIQKALEVIELDQKAQLVHELDGHVMRCVRDQNGNHVIQKCIESIPSEKIGFIISAFRGQVATLSMHPYGCRVIQRVLEHCADELRCQFIVDEILESVCALAQDQYGNYVTQHVLERGKPNERSQIISKLSGHVVQLSQHKFASNVVEKCLEYGSTTERDLIIEEIFGHNEGNDNLLIMMKDQFANYVVQKILEICTENQRAMLLSLIRSHVHALKKYTYGKHIVARFEQQFGEENLISGS